VNDLVLKEIKAAVEELNEDLDYESLENVSENTPLFDQSGDSIDSLSLVTLITDLETRLKKALGKPIVLADEGAMAMEQSPYRNVGALLEFTLVRAKA
jgi:acyl carrier protein